jgi:thiamine transporter
MMKKNQVRIMTEIGMAVAVAAILNFIPLWMTEIGMAVALAAIFNFITLWRMPQGGSVNLEMLPILIIAFRWGAGPGMMAGVVYGLVQLALGPYIIHPLFLAVFTGGLARFVSHFLSGVIFFAQYAPEGQSPWVYSAIYNVSYLLPSLLLSYIIIIPLIKILVISESENQR